MYLAHINFRPVDGARLVDTVPADAAPYAGRVGSAAAARPRREEYSS